MPANAANATLADRLALCLGRIICSDTPMRPNFPLPPASEAAARISRWLDVMRTSDKLLLAGLRRKVGPDGDLAAAYRQWYAEHMRDHDVAVQRMARRPPDDPQEFRDAG
jgi:hypothetical protein